MVSRAWPGLFAVALMVSFPGPDDVAAAPVVPGFERFGRSDGQLLLGELNCVLCHQPPAGAGPARLGPVLDQVGQRVRVSYLRKFLQNPHEVKPGTTMPHLFADDPERGAKVEALVHFLASTGSPRQERPDNKAIGAGRDLYHKLGCVACHGSRTPKGEPDKTTTATVPLVGLKNKYTIPSLAAFLENPHQVRPSGRMPSLLLADSKDRPKEAKELANFLLQGLKVDAPTGTGTTTFAYYEGTWDKVPDFSKLKPLSTGVSSAFDLGPARRRSNYAMKFDAYLKIDKEGAFRFHLTSDDGSNLYVDGKKVIDNDKVHPPATVSGMAMLTPGVHQVTVTFFQAGGGDELSAEVQGPGIMRQSLSGLVAADEAALSKIVKPAVAKDDEDYLDLQPSLVEKGKALFASAGCASCHQVKGLISQAKAQPLAKLTGTGGCLSATPTKSAPWFALDEAQRKSLTDAVRHPAAPAKTPAETITRTFLTFNCYACHVRDKIGGPEAALDKLFLTTQPEMGDEARIPPPLDNVGAKLRPEYMKQILDRGAHDRPYMQTRMPAFGGGNVGHLQAAFAEADKGKYPLASPVAFTEPNSKIKSAGRHMVGAQAFGCIKCHTFAGNKAEGVQGIDMVLLPTRLQRDWFVAYLKDPQKIRPGTRMPTIYDKGKSLLTNVLDGVPAKQTEAIWSYLLDGKKAQLPLGVKKDPIPLEPVKEAIVYRNFIEGAGSRAIGVGYPEKVSLAFDANDMRLALLWHGAFIDASRHWTGRGVGFEGPLGDNILALPPGSTFALLESQGQAWPSDSSKNQGFRFLGYQLTPDERPTFLYSVAEIRIEDFPNAAANGKDVGIRRMLNLTALKDVDNLYYRAAVGNKIEPLGNGVYRVDGQVRIMLTSHSSPIVRQSNGKTELLVPVSFTNRKARIVQEYSW